MSVDRVEEAISQIRSLPTLPSVLAQVLKTISDPEASALDLARQIASDQSLAANLLKLVNSAFYGFARKIDSVPEAVVILGFFQVRNLALATSAFTQMPRGNSSYDRGQLWRHSLAVAMTADRCAKRHTLESEGGAFSAGLLHDIGKVVLDSLYPQLFRQAAEQAHATEGLLVAVEPGLFGLDHTQAGGLLARHWHLPVSVATGVRWHHNPCDAEKHTELACLISVADFLAYEAGMGESGNGRAPDPPEEAGQRIRIPPDQWGGLVAELADASERVDALLGSLAAGA